MEPPTQQEFTETVREAFAFLRQFGFEEVSPHPHRAKDAFQVWFRADQRLVIVQGEGWGTMASVMPRILSIGDAGHSLNPSVARFEDRRFAHEFRTRCSR